MTTTDENFAEIFDAFVQNILKYKMYKMCLFSLFVRDNFNGPVYFFVELNENDIKNVTFLVM